MKKTIVRIFVLSLAVTLLFSMQIVPVFAGPTDTATFTLFNDDMSGTIQSGAQFFGSNPSSYADYFNGNQWGQLAQSDWNDWKEIYTDNGDMSFRAARAVTALIAKRALVNSPIIGETQRSNVNMIYDVQTGARTTNTVKLYATVDDTGYKTIYDSVNAIRMSSYNSNTGEFKHEGWNGGSVILSENTEYRITYSFVYYEDSIERGHILNIIITDKSGSATIERNGSMVSETTLSVTHFYKNDIKTIKGIGFISEATGTMDKVTEYFRVKNIQIDNIITGDMINFGDLEYDIGTVVKFNENMSDFSVSDLAATSSTHINTPGFDDGETWVFTNSVASPPGSGWAADGLFANDGTYLWAKAVNASTNGHALKKFTPISNGEVMTFTTTYRTSKSGQGDSAGAIRLYSADRLFFVDVVMVGRKSGTGAYSVWTLGTNGWGSMWNDDYNGTKLVRDTYFDSADSKFNKDTDIPLTLTMEPSGGNYLLTVTTGIGNTYTATKTITAAQATSLSIIDIFDYNNWGDAVNKFFGVKNINITSVAAVPKSALTLGNNTVYVPFENITGHATDFALVAAVYDKTDANMEIKDAAIAEYTGVTSSTKLAIDGINITDTTNEYVVVYLLKDFESLMPYALPLSTLSE